MLKRVGHPVDEKGAAVAIKDATFPVPFAPGLEFNSPVHGNWNIVHTGMLMPEARQIYVCADNCMRGVVLTAAEMNVADRFSFVIVKEENLLVGRKTESSSFIYRLSASFSGMRSGTGVSGTGREVPKDYIYPLLYGSDHAEAWTDTGSEAEKSDL